MTRQGTVYRYLTVTLLISFSLSCGIIGAFGAQTNWVSLVSIRDQTGNAPVPIGQPLLAGHSYNITIRVDVPFSQSGSKFTVNLDSLMNPAGTQYWFLLTKNYGGYDSASFTPGEKAISFNQVEGPVQIAVLLSVPADITVKQALGTTFRFLQKDYQIIQVSVTGGSVVGSQTFDLSDSSIENYLKTEDQKFTLIQAGQIDKTYEALVESFLAQADAVYKLGLPEKATEILNTINTASFPAPQSNSLQVMLTGAAVLMTVAAVVGFMMYSRANSKASMRSSEINEARNELAGLEVTAARYDDSLAGQLRRLREKLSEQA